MKGSPVVDAFGMEKTTAFTIIAPKGFGHRDFPGFRKVLDRVERLSQVWTGVPEMAVEPAILRSTQTRRIYCSLWPRLGLDEHEKRRIGQHPILEMSWEVAKVCQICQDHGWIEPTIYEGLYNAFHRAVSLPAPLRPFFLLL